MKTTELRLGNYVNVPRADQVPFRIDGFEYLSKDYCKVEQSNGTYGVMGMEVPFHPLTWELKDLSGIQLNPYWLNKFGARSLPHGYFIGKLKFTYEINELSEFIRFHYSGKVTYLRYVHKLQNLYFAITGKELVIVDTGKGSGFILERDLKLK